MADTTFNWSDLFGNLVSGGASLYAGSQLTDAQKKALAAQQAAAGTATGNLAPYQAIGANAAKALSTGDYTGTQLYKTGLAESENAINRALSSRGLYNSGGALSQLQKNAQNYNTNYTGTLGNLANMGLQATNSANNLAVGLGNATGASGIGQTQSNLSGIAGLLSALGSGTKTSGTGSTGSSTLGSLAGLLGNGASSLYDWATKPDNYGNTAEGQNVIDWYNKNYGTVEDTQPDYYNQGESDTNWSWDGSNWFS